MNNTERQARFRASRAKEGMKKLLFFWLTTDDYTKMLKFQKRKRVKSQSDVIAVALHRLWATEGLV